MSSIGKAYAILKGNLTGDKEAARNLIEQTSPLKRKIKNILEARAKINVRKKYFLKPGQRS